MYGPGTNGGEILSVLMSQAKHIVRAIKRMRRQGVTELEVKPTWVDVYNAWLQSKVDETSFAIAPHNYYKSPTGKVVTQWPYGAKVYGALVRTLGGASQRARRPHASLVDQVSQQGSSSEPQEEKEGNSKPLVLATGKDEDQE
jgi:hypothetical protein